MSQPTPERDLAELDTDVLARRVFASHPGGEDGFWAAWAAGRVGSEVRGWTGRHAAELGVEAEIALAEVGRIRHAARAEALKSPDDRWERRLALEALVLATPGPGRITELASGLPFEVAQLRERIRAALFDLLADDLDIDLATVGSEAEVGTRLIRALFHDLTPEEDDPPVSFAEIRDWLARFRHRAADPAPLDPVEAAVARLAGPYLERRPDAPERYRYEPSFRLFVRSRLKAFCRAEGWQPRPATTGGRFHSLDAAFAALSRQRIGAALRTVGWSVIDQWLEVDAAIA